MKLLLLGVREIMTILKNKFQHWIGHHCLIQLENFVSFVGGNIVEDIIMHRIVLGKSLT
jgi:hypothetical protein